MCLSSEVAHIIGVTEMIRLQGALEGWHYIAERPGPNNKIAQVLGVRKARLLGKHFATERLWVGKGYLKSDRNKRVQRAFERGAGTAELAGRFGLTQRQVRNIVER